MSFQFGRRVDTQALHQKRIRAADTRRSQISKVVQAVLHYGIFGSGSDENGRADVGDGQAIVFERLRHHVGGLDAAGAGDVNRNDMRITGDRKSTRLNSSHLGISYAVFCLKKKKLKT